ncbi:glycosyltransferase family 4 protein [bacterium]|nr:glycosyltransferase family 4 protein [bacterium]
MMKDLVKLGCRVTLIGHPGSKVGEIGVELIPENKGPWQDLVPGGADIIQLFYPTHENLPKPTIFYICGNAKPGEVLPLNTVFASESHARNHSSKCFVHHGVDFDSYPTGQLVNSDRWKKFAFLAKASWKIKNLDSCIRAVKVAKAELYIGGGRGWSFSRNIHWLGMLDDAEQMKLFQKTDAFLWPVRWPEPFGLAPVVAMSYGLPVLASQHGSSRELVDDPGVGLVCESFSKFVEAIQSKPDFYSSKQIQEYAREKFKLRHMTNKFLDLYKRVVAGESLNAAQPLSSFREPSDKVLLPF